MREVFRIREEEYSSEIVTFRVSFIEIYNEELKDLLHPEITSREILIREDSHGKIFFTGAREVTVRSYEDAIRCLEEGCLNRTTGGTLMNDFSSRSHSVFTLSVDVLNVQEAKEIKAKLHLVDLAGSERAKRTGASGTRLKESVGINQGLMTLGKVIRALTSPQGSIEGKHIPYRESKLTRLLQDSLGGNSRTIMIACVSPNILDLQETLLTLQYATRAKAVQNKVTANVVSVPLVLEDYDPASVASETTDAVIKTLQNELFEAKESLRKYQLAPSSSPRRLNETSNTLNAQKLLYIHTELIALLKIADNSVDEIDSTTMDELKLSWITMKNRLSEILSSFDSYDKHSAAQFQRVNLRASMEARSSLDSTLIHNPAVAVHIENLLSIHTAEIEVLKAQLDDAQQDLKRDEEIFMEKVKEIKKCRRTVRQMEDDNTALRARVSELEICLKAKETSNRSPSTPAMRISSSKKLNTTSRADFDFEAEDLEISSYVAGDFILYCIQYTIDCTSSVTSFFITFSFRAGYVSTD